jgi:hypothetical protein
VRANPGASILGDSRKNTTVFSAPSRYRAAPNRFPTILGKEKGAVMKFATVSKSLLMGTALLLATSAFAGTKADLQLHNPTTVNGTTLKPGDYKLEWEGTGNVQVSIMKGKNVVAKVPARVVDLPSPAVNTAAMTSPNSDGTVALAGARFQGKTFALELSDTASGTSAGSSK